MGRRAEEAWWDPEDEQLIAWGPALVVCRPEGTARRVRHAFSALSVHRAALKHGIDRIDVELPDEPPGPEPYLADVGPRRGVWTPERVGCGQGLLGHPAASLWLSAPGTKDKPLPLISVLDLRQRAMRAAEAGVRVGLRGVQADRFSEGGPWVLGAVCHAGRPDPRGSRYPVLLGFVSLTSSSSGLLLAGFLEATTVAAGRAGVSPVLQGLEFTQCGSVCPCSPPFVPTRLGMLARKEGGLGYECWHVQDSGASSAGKERTVLGDSLSGYVPARLYDAGLRDYVVFHRRAEAGAAEPGWKLIELSSQPGAGLVEVEVDERASDAAATSVQLAWTGEALLLAAGNRLFALPADGPRRRLLPVGSMDALRTGEQVKRLLESADGCLLLLWGPERPRLGLYPATIERSVDGYTLVRHDPSLLPARSLSFTGAAGTRLLGMWALPGGYVGVLGIDDGSGTPQFSVFTLVPKAP